ncbi:hypothetical protein L7F22_001717 [Adiantum nelumboides]|nr:hypothetical protein [Adiantum nelumboides]
MDEEVCVTGGTGYLASHVIRSLLLKGYRVRATVRNQGLFHVAAPVHVPNFESPEKSYLEPCLQGTLNVLKCWWEAQKGGEYEKRIKRVVYTSSCAAIRYNFDRCETDPPLDESVWSNLEYCRHFKLWYPWPKTAAEKEAWRFAHEKGLELVVVNPSYVVGPTLSSTPTSTIEQILNLLRGSLKTYPNKKLGFVHIDDVVSAHVVAYENSLASGRLICSGDVYHWEEITSMLSKKYPKYPIPKLCGDEQGNSFPHRMNTSKLQNLGLHYFKGLEQMFDDCISSLCAHGLLQ